MGKARRLGDETPAGLGFVLPAEWEWHSATWLAWPHHRTDWPGKLGAVRWVYGEIVRALTGDEQVALLVGSERERVCAVCHIPQPGGPLLQGTADIPTFPEIARKEGQTADLIVGAIILPSHPMPQIVLTRDQMADIAAYVLSLR